MTPERNDPWPTILIASIAVLGAVQVGCAIWGMG
jgi:hypothetical protein